MKKMNLIAPEVCKGFFGERRREMVRYLKIGRNLGKLQLKEDIKNGAVFFETLRAFADRPTARTVVIRTDNKEVGLMAVSYIAGICNEQDNMREADDRYVYLSQEAPGRGPGGGMFGIGENTHESDGWMSGADENTPGRDEEIFDPDEELFEPDGTGEGDETMDFEVWEESPYMVPIIEMSEIFSYDGTDSFSDFGSPFYRTQANGSSRRKDPYWADCTEEPVCILCGRNDYVNYSEHAGARFKRNRRVYLLEVPDGFGGLGPLGGFGGCPPDIFGDADDPFSMADPNFARMVLEDAATVIDLTSDATCQSDSFLDYRITQFENWAESEQLKLAADFPKQKVVARILKMNDDDKSELFHRILHYIVVQGNAGEYIREDDFEVLNRFVRLSTKKGAEAPASVKLEKQLYGMEAVKERVHEIVDVLMYHKRREELGLTNGSFHNVHLLIGAPGTAKTTVARYMGEMMAEKNLLPGNRFTCVNGADLKGMYVGHTAPKVHRLFEENDIIMIDEAYSLAAHDSSDSWDSFSQEAVSTLITEIEEHGTEKLVLLAGYGGMDVEEKDNLMKLFIDANPGLKSRINSTIYFESYTARQMVEILHLLARNQNFSLSREADGDVCRYFEERRKHRSFGNGRETRSLLETATIFAATRTKGLSARQMTRRRMRQISASDIRKAIERLSFAARMQEGRNGRGRIGFNVS